MIPVILSGGSGARLWPLSRQSCPKQFLDVHTEKTLFQETVLRLKKLNLLDPIVVCNEDHRFSVANNIQDIGCTAQEIILEPVGRNTAPAIAAAALTALESNEDPIIIVLPADHAIENEIALARSFEAAKEMATQGFLVTFGVKPTSAHTGYGYIKLGKTLDSNVNEVTSFIEKPNKKTAEGFVEDGGYLWNSGMFCFKASRYLSELEVYQPELVQHVKQAVINEKNAFNFLRLNQKDFEKCNNISIDYAVMEKTQKGCVVSIEADWRDIGSWDAVWEASKKDKNNNVCKGDIISQDTTNSFIFSQNKLLVTLGVDNLMIVDTPDALLVAEKSKTQNVKSIVEQLKESDRNEVKNHSKVDRPWGHYNLLHDSDASEIKHVFLKPGAKIVLQKHKHRSEHWVVLQGKAKVTKGDETFHLVKNESVYIPVGVYHSLENDGNTTLEIIEVRTGGVIDENDTIRANG